MPRVLIIAENSFQQERLCAALNLTKDVQFITANLRQISPKNIKNFQQADLIVLEDTAEQADPRTTEYLLSSLKKTGLPIVLLPPTQENQLTTEEEPLVLNLTETSIAKPGLAALINKIREQYVMQTQADREQAQLQRLSRQRQFPSPETPAPNFQLESSWPSDRPPTDLDDDAQIDSRTLFADPPRPPQRPEVSTKVTYAIAAMGRISKQLREPLSNMNLAIHMLGRVQSIEERDRYVKLLREEYQRELQLVNELENLHNSLETIL